MKKRIVNIDKELIEKIETQEELMEVLGGFKFIEITINLLHCKCIVNKHTCRPSVKK